MTREQLKANRRELGLNQTEMAKRLRTPLRSYLAWKRGERRIPGLCETAMELLIAHDRRVMQAVEEVVQEAEVSSFPGTGTRLNSMPTAATARVRDNAR